MICCFSATVTEHIQGMDAVLGRLQQEGLKAKLEKSSFVRPEVNYLGYIISREGVATDPGKIETVAGWPRPNHVSELRFFFLGVASYYRCFVEGFAKLAASFHHLVAQLTGTKAQRQSGGSLHAAWTGV